MNIEVGKWYWCRNKKEKRFVVGKNPNGGSFIVVNSNDNPSKRELNGQLSPNFKDELDLVEEVKPERWVGLHYYGKNNVGVVGNYDIQFSSGEEVVNWYKSTNQFDRFIKAVKVE